MHKHHIVFESQGGLTYPLNLIYLSLEDHEGNKGPHLNRERDLELKKDLQDKLYKLFSDKEAYTIEEISKRLGRTPRYFGKHFRKVPMAAGLYKRDDIIYKLMGGKFY